MPNRTEKITIRLPSRFVEALDLLVGVDDFPSRSEAIRAAVRDLVYTRSGLVIGKAKKLGQLQRDVARLKNIEIKYLNK
jgi:Arc/MetJ-type ribon-helix-helix transcriptional regulator